MDQSIASALGLEITPDPGLERVLRIAAIVGEAGGDETLLSYTSLFIGLLWASDEQAVWMGVPRDDAFRIDDILARRSLKASDEKRVLEQVDSGELPRRLASGDVKDALSISARTMLRNAAAIQREVGETDAMTSTHLLAAYLFRNPPGHDRDLRNWLGDLDTWRRAFAAFTRESRSDDASGWRSVFTGLDDTAASRAADPSGKAESDETLPPETLQSYVFAGPAVGLLWTIDHQLEGDPATTLTSDVVAGVLLNLATSKDRVVSDAERELGARFDLPDRPSSADADIGRRVSPDLKQVLDTARTLAIETTGEEVIGVRHVAAGLALTQPAVFTSRDFTASRLRQQMLDDVTAGHPEDRSDRWRLNLIGIAPPAVARYDADRADRGDDQLDVTRYATAFASVMAARSMTPPLSIGVFGDWGSGKSFFMRLMRQQTTRVLDYDHNTESPLFLRNVVNVEFNAWHYAETNLLASLVQAIYTAVRSKIHGTEDAVELQTLLASLATAQDEQTAARRALAEAERTRAKSETDMKAARLDAATARRQIETIRAQDIFEAVKNEGVIGDHVRTAIDTAEERFGVTGIRAASDAAGATLNDAAELVAQVRALGVRSWSLWRILGQSKIPTAAWIAVGVVTALLLVIGVGLAAWLQDAWPVVATMVTQILALGGAGVAWASRQVRSVNEFLTDIEQIQSTVEARVAARRREAEDRVARKEQDLQNARDRERDAAEQVVDAEAKIARLERELARQTPGARLERLITTRLDDGTYEQHLGLVSLIRRDFNRIGGWLEQLGRKREADGPPIDRIVLYIDDLDRCPSDKVVDVLEAIHLLLAFPLFVVVVGVDVRWTERSLRERYPHHLSDTGDDGGRRSAAPLDYLEKIFQIPFWLPPMGETVSRGLIGALIGDHGDLTGADGGDQPETGPDGSDGETTPRRQSAAATPADATATAGAGSESIEAARLPMTSGERRHMLRLAGAVGKSPRRLKRFVNTYRILKSSCNPQERATFVVEDGKRGDFFEAMTLLAIITAAPRAAREVLTILAPAAPSPPADLDGFFKAARAAGRRFPTEYEYVDAALKAYAEACADDNDTDVRRLERMRSWAPQTARFSFRSGGG